MYRMRTRSWKIGRELTGGKKEKKAKKKQQDEGNDDENLENEKTMNLTVS